MYTVRRTSNNEIVAICSQLNDAEAWTNTKLDGQTYYVEDSESESKMINEYEDGIGEGQPS